MNAHPRRSAKGFTLVEVLVAVLILAIALSAVVATMARQADNAGHLKTKAVALWVAHDRLTEMQLAKTWPATGKTDGEIEMAGTKWKWRAEVKAAPGEEKLRRIDVYVALPKDKPGSSLASVSGFMMETK